MLSRVANSFFWLARYAERAETIARILDVNYNRATDLYSQRDGRAERLWRSVMQCAGFVPDPVLPHPSKAASAVLSFCAFDENNPTSILSALRIVRTNTLGIRAELTTEVWENVNLLYHFMERQTLRSVLREGPSSFLRHIRDWLQAGAGMSDATLNHGEGWNFMQAGRFLERAYMTTRILQAVDIEHEPWHESQRLLEMCCAAVPFAQQAQWTPDSGDVLEFIALSGEFPRSLRFCAREIEAALHRISGAPEGTFANRAERRAGRLCADLDYTTADELGAGGVDEFVAELQRDLEQLSAEIEESYFPRSAVAEAV